MTIDRARKLKGLALWHRRVALVVCVWLLVLAGSGLLINHSHDWGLDRSSLAVPLQRLLYGIEPDGEDSCHGAVALESDCAGDSISWERFLLDLHAARFLGGLASILTDLMGGLILLLALSGLWLWWLKRPADRPR